MTCSTCSRPVDAPWRLRSFDGRLVEGCVDAAHDGHLSGENAAWHNRPEARRLRANVTRRLRRGVR